MKILITGANGLLGQKLVQLLVKEQGVDPIATGRGSCRLPDTLGSFKYREMDISDRQQVEEVISNENPDVLINTAAMTQVDECEQNQEKCWELNVEAVKHLVNACSKANTFLIHLSTDFIFDGEDGPYDEEARPNPISFYGESKLGSEKVITDSKTDWAIVRTVLVYGIAHDMSRSNIILWVKNSLEQGKPIKVVTDQWRTPTLAEDLAYGCYLVAKKKAKGIFNISGKDFLTPYDMAVKTADFFKLDKNYMTKADASNFSQPAKRPPRTGFIINKAREVLGYDPHSFEEGIEIVYQQMKSAKQAENP